MRPFIISGNFLLNRRRSQHPEERLERRRPSILFPVSQARRKALSRRPEERFDALRRQPRARAPQQSFGQPRRSESTSADLPAASSPHELPMGIASEYTEVSVLRPVGAPSLASQGAPRFRLVASHGTSLRSCPRRKSSRALIPRRHPPHNGEGFVSERLFHGVWFPSTYPV
jgi:hypothetical protein